MGDPKVSRRGVLTVAHFEGFSPRAYDLEGRGILTVGYGTTDMVRDFGPGFTISERKAKRWLRADLDRRIVPQIPGARRMRQQEVDALGSIGYNCGPGVLIDPTYSTLARRLKTKEARTFEGRCRIYRDEFPKWVSPGTPFEEGLRRRRRAEVRLACRGRYPDIP